MSHEAAEVLIVGGGIAGSALAILLGRQGFTVELLERGQFPKDKPCGEGMMPAGVAVLKRLGLAEAAGGVRRLIDFRRMDRDELRSSGKEVET